MKKLFLFLSSILAPTSFVVNAQSIKPFYDFKPVAIDGSTFDFAQLKGKKVMIVNTASKCGFTKQYEGLEALYKKYSGKNFIIIGFPSNNFASQEPGTNEEIANFCKINFGVTFPMMAKINVKGDSIHPLYQWLTQKELNGQFSSVVKWNFQKYLIDENGKLVKVYYSITKPDDKKIVEWIESTN
ncbi:MAG TPA: glutathione peroxidase [Bacteroidales bacterium]|nr:glutathione peroxidase [Bacteroidales bacterium]